ncbi:MAG: TolC family protein [Verrucomicrobiota bacterium]
MPKKLLYRGHSSARAPRQPWAWAILLILMSLRLGAQETNSALVATEPNPAAHKLGLQALIDLAIAHDPDILRLKRQVDIERARAKFAAPRRSPELRLGYSHGSDPATPRPFTEIREETITESGNRSTHLNRKEASSGRETRDGTESRTGPGARTQDFSERRSNSEDSSSTIRESENFRETTTRSTRRDVIPRKRGETVRTTVEERSNESFSEQRTESASSSGREDRDNSFSGSSGSGTDDDTFSTSSSENSTRRDSGSSSTRVISESVSERSFDRDSSDGSDQFSAQIRIFPRNPWETAAREERAQGAVFLAQYRYDAEVRALSNVIRQIYMELQFLRAQVGLSDNKLNFIGQEIAFHRKLFEAGRGGADDLVATQIDAINLQKERHEAEDTLHAGKSSLAVMAHIEDLTRIDLGDAMIQREVDINELELDQVLAAAMVAHNRAGILSLEQSLTRLDMAVVEAEKYPWFTLLSATYAYEERFNYKYQDEFSIVAGVTLPVFDWFSREDKTEPYKLEIQALEDRQMAIREKLRYKIMLGLGRLKKSRTSAEAFAREYGTLKEGIVAMKDKLGRAGGLNANKQEMALKRHLVDLDARALAIGQEYARALLEFESMLDVDLDALGN